MAIAVIIVASLGCAHAEGVTREVLAQLDANDELLLVEPVCTARPSAATAKPGGPRIVHVTADSADEFSAKVVGIAASTADAAVILENHGVPGPEFFNALRDLIRADIGELTTFYYANGTPGDAPSEAAFLYVGGYADPRSGPEPPAVIASSFALWGQTLDRVRTCAREGALPTGDLEYEVVPRCRIRANGSISKDLVIVHFQRNTLKQALAANYWNARRTGDLERSMVARRGRVLHMTRRYLERSVRLAHRHRASPRLTAALLLIGGAGFTGWWAGRWQGSGDFAERMADTHEIPVR